MRRRPLLSLPLVALAPPSTRAQGKPLRVGVEDFEYFLPYSQYQGRVYRGLGRDLLDAFASDQGLRFDYLALPAKRRVPMFLAGELDLIFPDHPDWSAALKRGHALHHSPLLPFSDMSLVRPADLGRGVGRLRRLGLPIGFTPVPYLEAIAAGRVQLEEVAGLIPLFERLQQGRIDAVYMNQRISAYFFAHHAPPGLAPALPDPDLPRHEGEWHLSSIRRPELIAALPDFLTRHAELVLALQQRWHWR